MFRFENISSRFVYVFIVVIPVKLPLTIITTNDLCVCFATEGNPITH